MHIEDAIALRKVLEGLIKDLINKYEKQTGVIVESVEVGDRVFFLGERPAIRTLRVTTRLPLEYVEPEE